MEIIKIDYEKSKRMSKKVSLIMDNPDIKHIGVICFLDASEILVIAGASMVSWAIWAMFALCH